MKVLSTSAAPAPRHATRSETTILAVEDAILSHAGMTPDPTTPRTALLTRALHLTGVGSLSVAASSPTPGVFQAGSISKPVFAVGVMRLVQMGRIDLDADVRVYLKGVWELACVLPGVEATAPVTMRMLLAHVAGTTVWGFGGYNRRALAEGTIEMPDVVGVLNGEGNSDPVVIERLPGFQMRYSGGGTTLAQLVIEQITQQPLYASLSNLVFAPLGLTRSTYVNSPIAPNGGDYACGNHESAQSAGPVPVPGGFHLYPESAAAGLWTTPEELCAVMSAVARSARGELVRREVFLKKELAVEMLTPRFAGYFGVGWMRKDERFFEVRRALIADNLSFSSVPYDICFVAGSRAPGKGGEKL
ncbi:beta-lactamase/transpeptidase-like protein [Blyttiomyces helicus]|uniref:Beta-lactamase/transpeptidase-like protein n=1 Tax=Blyttiomyces helicus TaxID=388810 RepID=A0A4P9WBQ1_9FUNG|nr:beta-lactamase/transpeptidase-like protein [Blyttiomyces helicus]|eukprot:RKO89045.1 beta-lactamase/transpeptidase-like protein [Blyttiomyces helicus]